MSITKNEIIESLFNDKEFDKVLHKYVFDKPRRDDLKQHIMLTLLDKEDCFIIDLYNRKELLYYVIRIVINSNYGQSDFNRLYDKRLEEINDDVLNIQDDDDLEAKEQLITDTQEAVNNLYHYYKNILHLYSKHGSYRKTAKAIGIPYKSVFNAVTKAKQEVKKQLKEKECSI